MSKPYECVRCGGTFDAKESPPSETFWYDLLCGGCTDETEARESREESENRDRMQRIAGKGDG